MKRRFAASMLGIAAVGLAPAHAFAHGPTVCVGSGSGCYSTIQAAVNAAHSGDVIHIGEGTFAGGVVIDKDVALLGTSARETIIRGGGPVLTIGRFDADREPTVTIRGVTITGGITHDSGAFGGTHIAFGGGIWVPPTTSGGTGATVTISQSVITGNRVAPTSTVSSGLPCPGGSCPFALAGGGGIDTWGTLSLTDTIVNDNVVAGSNTSDADGAGIDSHEGSLTLERAVISGNRAIASSPTSRFAEGGGMMVDAFPAPPQAKRSLTMRDSVVADNTVTLSSSLPSFAGGGLINMGANSGGIHVGDNIPTSVDNTVIAHNSVTATDLKGEPIAFDAGVLIGDSPLHMTNALINGNHSTTIAATSKDVGPGGSAIELDGPGMIVNTRIADNSSTEVSPNGAAAVNGALAVLNFNGDPKLVTVLRSVISGNSAGAFSTTGSASALGGGVFTNSLLLMRDVQVTQNVERADAPTGLVEGGGIWNGVDLSGPPVMLTLENVVVARNTLRGSDGITLRGGGIFTTLPITIVHTVIRLNRPDQCVGC